MCCDEVDHRPRQGWEKELDKAVLTTEFGLSHTVEGFDHSHQELFYRTVFNTIYESAK
jgi:hypothetical protein